MTPLWNLRGRHPKPDRIVAGERQTFDAGLWAVTLPLDWELRSGSEPVSIETKDRTKRLEVSVTKLEDPQQTAERMSRAIVAVCKGELGRMRGYHWQYLRDDRAQIDDGAVAVLEVHDPDRGHRICTQVLVRGPTALRAAFHDYDCVELSRSRAYFSKPMQSLRLRRRVKPAGD